MRSLLLKSDKSGLNSLGLRKSVNTILEDHRYAANASKIGDSSRNTGGYRQEVKKSFLLKCQKTSPIFKISVSRFILLCTVITCDSYRTGFSVVAVYTNGSE